MNMQPHPGYECLWNLSTEVAPGDQVGFDRKMAEITHYSPPEGIEIRDFAVPGPEGAPPVPVRIYRDPASVAAPLLINIHGGGFVGGSINRDDHRAAAFAAGVPCTVLSVEYRLAPKAVFPAQIEDCLAVLGWACDHASGIGIDRTKIAVLGTSAGGAIAAGLCLWIRDKGGPRIALQILNYPTLDCKPDTISAMQYWAGSPMIAGPGMNKVWGLYLGGFNGVQPSYYAIPAVARDLSGLPPACIVTCEYDPLREEGIEYARRLMGFGVQTELYSLPRVPHSVDLVPAPLTQWIREGMYYALRREFGML
jgi:acetyl esterase/lipase